MKILYITHFDVNNINSCSGTIYHIKRVLEKMGNEVIVIDNLKINRIFRFYKKAFGKISGKKVLVEREPFILKSFAKQLEAKTKGLEYDIVFSPSSLYYTFYKDSKPMVFYTDATLGGMVDYYISSKEYTKKSIRNGFNQEKLSLKNSDLAIYASEWAKQTAIEFHDAEANKCIVVNRGANIKHSFSKGQIFDFIKRRNLSIGIKKCSFMFLGTDWIRKGGQLGCEIIRILNEEYNIEAQYNVIGCTPRLDDKYSKYVNVIGYLDKSNDMDYKRLEKVFAESDFFLLPTRQEAQGISYAEACSWGLPVIATNTGGVSGIVKNKVNGLILESSDTPEKYVEELLYYINNKNKYVNLCINTYTYFENNLNWDKVGKDINKILIDLH